MSSARRDVDKATRFLLRPYILGPEDRVLCAPNLRELVLKEGIDPDGVVRISAKLGSGSNVYKRGVRKWKGTNVSGCKRCRACLGPNASPGDDYTHLKYRHAGTGFFMTFGGHEDRHLTCRLCSTTHSVGEGIALLDKLITVHQKRGTLWKVFDISGSVNNAHSGLGHTNITIEQIQSVKMLYQYAFSHYHHAAIPETAVAEDSRALFRRMLQVLSMSGHSVLTVAARHGSFTEARLRSIKMLHTYVLKFDEKLCGTMELDSAVTKRLFTDLLTTLSD